MPLSPSPALAYKAHGNCYLNLTNRCTLRCGFCPKFRKDWVVDGYDLRLGQEPEAEDLLAAIGDPRAFQEVVFCGLGEPTLRWSVLLEVADRIQQAGAAVRLNTDGLASWRAGHDVTPELAGRIDTVSISLNAQSETVYNRHCRPPGKGALPAVLEFASRSRERLPRVILTAIEGLEGVDIPACRALAEECGVELRVRRLDRVG